MGICFKDKSHKKRCRCRKCCRGGRRSNCHSRGGHGHGGHGHGGHGHGDHGHGGHGHGGHGHGGHGHGGHGHGHGGHEHGHGGHGHGHGGHGDGSCHSHQGHCNSSYRTNECNPCYLLNRCDVQYYGRDNKYVSFNKEAFRQFIAYESKNIPCSTTHFFFLGRKCECGCGDLIYNDNDVYYLHSTCYDDEIYFLHKYITEELNKRVSWEEWILHDKPGTWDKVYMICADPIHRGPP